MLKKIKNALSSLFRLNSIFDNIEHNFSVCNEEINELHRYIGSLQLRLIELDFMDKKLVDLEAKLAHLVCGKPPSKPKQVAKKTKVSK